MTRRERLEAAVQWVADDVDREEQIAGVEAMVEQSFENHNGWWRDHKHPFDRAAEMEEAWKFGKASP